MTSEQIQQELKKYSSELQLNKDPHNILMMEAMCEIQDLQAKFGNVQREYIALLKGCKKLSEAITELGNGKVVHPDWNDPNWQVGYITGVSDALAMINSFIQEGHINEAE